jgi:hypothetical protein
MEVTETREEEEIKETKFQYISTIKFPMVSINPIFVSSKLVLHPLPSRLHLLLLINNHMHFFDVNFDLVQFLPYKPNPVLTIHKALILSTTKTAES